MNDPSEIESLSILDLDVELLEERIEMSTILHPLGYVCVGNIDCVSHSVKPSTLPHS